MTVSELIVNNIGQFSIPELLAIKSAVNNLLGGENLAVDAYEYKKHQGMLQALKYVKEKTGWGLKECKEYIDRL